MKLFCLLQLQKVTRSPAKFAIIRQQALDRIGLKANRQALTCVCVLQRNFKLKMLTRDEERAEFEDERKFLSEGEKPMEDLDRSIQYIHRGQYAE